MREILILLAFPVLLLAQEHKIDTIQENNQELHTLSDFFSKGRIKGHFRTYFMSTNNNKNLSDYYAIGTGLGVGYETSVYKGLQGVISGFIIHNIASSDLSEPDPLTGALNRYEIGLFDIEHRDNKHDLDRLEELYIKYTNNNHTLIFGKQFLETPVLNAQDSRMRPNLFEGLTYEYFDPDKKINWSGGFIYRFSPRSTVEWYNTTETIGLYNKSRHEDNEGINPDSKGVLYGKIGYKSNGLIIDIWDFYFENLINNSLFTSTYENRFLKVGVQLFYQYSVLSNSFEDFYHEHDHQSGYISVMGGYKLKKGMVKAAYTRISEKGQFLIPREYGKEKMFTTMPRERMEGIADAHAYNLSADFEISNSIDLRTSLGYYNLPEPSDSVKNRYGLPSFYQGVVDFNYKFHGFLDGMEAHFLLTHKLAKSDKIEPEYEINKVNMTNFSIILNYHFNQSKQEDYHGHK
ncbi:hypothetical protein OO013_09040 [Mangrovivirga sp. M17]|uniref:Outer membrane porin, OprD family n=1 Tax=Mangrovivirga halotolerans TaxID=2993936 RepID=A0ABT3RQD8_9BACT|nr:hypothetical protein [Mangrovivirga halotolerans]MCX2744008.1 hypothetical protein [Mangrovivirga halotolerans]